MENKKVERRADDGRIEAFVAGCHADIEEYIVIPFDGIFHDRMMAVQLVDIVQERLAGRSLRAGAQMHADEKVHAVIRNDSRHDLVACAGRQRCHENHRIKRVMHILTAEEIQPFCLHILFESIRFQILMPNPLRERSHIICHKKPPRSVNSLSITSIIQDTEEIAKRA